LLCLLSSSSSRLGLWTFFASWWASRWRIKARAALSVWEWLATVARDQSHRPDWGPEEQAVR
jgi:hypothetical protein